PRQHSLTLPVRWAHGTRRGSRGGRPAQRNHSPFMAAETKTATLGWPFVHRGRPGSLGALLRGGSGSRGGACLGVAGEVFLDACLAAFQPAQVVQLAGTDGAAALDLHRIDG